MSQPTHPPLPKLPDPSTISNEARTAGQRLLSGDDGWYRDGNYLAFKLPLNVPVDMEVAAAMLEQVHKAHARFKPDNFRDTIPPYIVSQERNDFVVKLTPEFRLKSFAQGVAGHAAG